MQYLACGHSRQEEQACRAETYAQALEEVWLCPRQAGHGRSEILCCRYLGIARRHERGRWHTTDPTTRRQDWVSSVRGQPKDFSQLTQPPTILSTSNAISFLQGRTEPFARRLWTCGAMLL